MRTWFRPRQCARFRILSLITKLDLWIITRLAQANDELGAIIGCSLTLRMQAESLLSTNPVLLRMPGTERADLAGQTDQRQTQLCGSSTSTALQTWRSQSGVTKRRSG
jgi:hypothetical protein